MAVSAATFWDKIPHTPAGEFRLEFANEINRTAGGGQISASLGVPLWRGKVVFGVLPYDEWLPLVTIIDEIQTQNFSFQVSDIRRRWPQSKPNGLRSNDYTAKVSTTKVSEGTLLYLSDITFSIMRGDLLTLHGGPSGTHATIHLHQVIVGTTRTPRKSSFDPIVNDEVRVVPKLPSNLERGKTVGFGYCYAKIVPGSVKYGRGRRGIQEGLSFEWVQTVRFY